MKIIRQQRNLRHRRGILWLLLFLLGAGVALIVIMWMTHTTILPVVSTSPDGYSMILPSSSSSSKTRTRNININSSSCLKNPPSGPNHHHNNPPPQPVILMTLGRSGSSSTWQILGNLTGYETYIEEYTGESSHVTMKFFTNVIGPNDYGNWVTNYFCQKQIQFPLSTLIGMKWKPHPAESVLQLPAAIHGLQKIAAIATTTSSSSSSSSSSSTISTSSTSSSSSSTTIIKVIRSRRNIIDVLLSELKHRISKVPPHCISSQWDYKICLEKHMKSYQKKINIPNIWSFYSEALTRYYGEERIDELLRNMNIPTIFVSYDTLYFPNTPQEGANEWNNILNFLIPKDSSSRTKSTSSSSASSLSTMTSATTTTTKATIVAPYYYEYTWSDITKTMKHGLTTASRKHSDLIENYKEFVEAFQDGPLEHLIRP